VTRKLLSILFFQLVTVTAFAQFSRQEADSMLNALVKTTLERQRIDLLLNLAQFHILKPGEFQADFDSASFFMNEAGTLNKTLKSPDAEGYLLLTETYLLRETGQRDEARKMNERAVTVLESGSNKSYLAMAYYELSWYYDHFDAVQRPEKIRLVERAVELFRQDGNTRKKARALEMLGDLYDIAGEHSTAIGILHAALAAYDSVGDRKLQGVYVILGGAYADLADYGQALSYLLKALKIAHALGDTSMQLCNINNNLAAIYSTVGRHDMSQAYAKDALAIAKKYKDEDAIFFLSVNLAFRYNRDGRPERGLEVLDSIPASLRSHLDVEDKAFLDEVYLRNYLSLKQYKKAETFVRPLAAAADGKMLIPKDKGIIYRLIAAYYFHANQYAKARTYLMKNLDPTIKRSYPYGTIQDSHLWYKLDSVRGDFRSAFSHLHYYQTKMDSILGENRIRQLQVLSVEYEIALKEDSIKLKDKNILLLTQQNRLQQAKLQQANLIKNVTVAGTILAFVIIGLLYRLYRQKRKSHKVVTQKNEQLHHLLTEKEWLLKEIHHRVKNNLQIVMSLLNSQSAYIDNEPALTAIHDSQHRVHAISLIHQKLYNAENVSSIDISLYIRELVSYLRDCFNTGQRIRFELNIEELEMDVAHAVPLGLILNEAITNSIKYAFPGQRQGVIAVTLTATETHFVLRISDNGIGMPKHLDANRPGSLGLSLIAGLTEDLEGSFSIESNEGTTLQLSFGHEHGVNQTASGAESFVGISETG
jgi:two-component system, sensor histidine kinase PdtaS